MSNKQKSLFYKLQLQNLLLIKLNCTEIIEEIKTQFVINL